MKRRLIGVASACTLAATGGLLRIDDGNKNILSNQTAQDESTKMKTRDKKTSKKGIFNICSPSVFAQSCRDPTMFSDRCDQIMSHGYPDYENLRCYEDFVLSYDTRTKIPVWTYEHFTKCHLRKNEVGENCDPPKFYPDYSFKGIKVATKMDYNDHLDEFERAQLAAEKNHQCTENARNETYCFSNVAPMDKIVYAKVWSALEEKVRQLTDTFPKVYVCTGPLFLSERDTLDEQKRFVKYNVIGENFVAVPTHFFKVVVGECCDGKLHLWAFLVKNCEPKKPFKVDDNCLKTTLDELERKTGLTFFENVCFASENGKWPEEVKWPLKDLPC